MPVVGYEALTRDRVCKITICHDERGWAVTIYDRGTGSNETGLPDKEHVEQTLEAAQDWACRHLGTIWLTALEEGLSNPCEKYPLQWEAVECGT
jgi:hypothetical protein